jgi:hypothetical protein
VGREDEGNANRVRRRAITSGDREGSKTGGLQEACREDSVAGCRDKVRYHVRCQLTNKRGEWTVRRGLDSHQAPIIVLERDC